ncbi:MAG TPA: Asp-tRNA(Asn)/Glu-tRNA(Gln) amidotransferase GatCAB subunit B, partial [Bacteroidia bacterium]|nr:Asp-tRNA(Asn)/Glu-tRNA(Gln) amidotransferase GatCAB subunit B [Bacteroidia bacterium]
VKDHSKTPMQIAEENNLVQSSDSDELLDIIKETLSKYPAKVAEYKGGKTGLMGLFMGEVMKLSRGKADPRMATELLKKELENPA